MSRPRRERRKVVAVEAVGLGEGSGGYGRVDLGGRKKDSVRIVPGQTTVVGGLARQLVVVAAETDEPGAVADAVEERPAECGPGY